MEEQKRHPVDDDWLQYCGIDPIPQQVETLLQQIDPNEINFDYSFENFTLYILQLQIDNLNRKWNQLEVKKNDIMEDLISVIAIVSKVKVSYSNLLEIQARNFVLIGSEVIPNAMNSFSLSPKDPLSAEYNAISVESARKELKPLINSKIEYILNNSLSYQEFIISESDKAKEVSMDPRDDQSSSSHPELTNIFSHVLSPEKNIIGANSLPILKSSRSFTREFYIQSEQFKQNNMKVKCVKLYSGRTATAEQIVPCVNDLMERTKRWWESGNVLFIGGDHQIQKHLTELIMTYSTCAENKENEYKSFEFIYPADSDWHKLSQHGVNLVTKLCKEAITAIVSMIRVVDPKREIIKCWQEGDHTILFGFEYVIRELAPYFFKSDVALYARSQNREIDAEMFNTWLATMLNAAHVTLFLELAGAYLVGQDGIRLCNSQMLRTSTNIQSRLYSLANKPNYAAISFQIEATLSQMSPLQQKIHWDVRCGTVNEFTFGHCMACDEILECGLNRWVQTDLVGVPTSTINRQLGNFNDKMKRVETFKSIISNERKSSNWKNKEVEKEDDEDDFHDMEEAERKSDYQLRQYVPSFREKRLCFLLNSMILTSTNSISISLKYNIENLSSRRSSTQTTSFSSSSTSSGALHGISKVMGWNMEFLPEVILLSDQNIWKHAQSAMLEFFLRWRESKKSFDAKKKSEKNQIYWDLYSLGQICRPGQWHYTLEKYNIKSIKDSQMKALNRQGTQRLLDRLLLSERAWFSKNGCDEKQFGFPIQLLDLKYMKEAKDRKIEIRGGVKLCELHINSLILRLLTSLKLRSNSSNSTPRIFTDKNKDSPRLSHDTKHLVVVGLTLFNSKIAFKSSPHSIRRIADNILEWIAFQFFECKELCKISICFDDFEGIATNSNFVSDSLPGGG